MDVRSEKNKILLSQILESNLLKKKILIDFIMQLTIK